MWRIQGSVPVPVQADDTGLLSRLVGICEDAGHKVSEVRADRIVFEQPRWLVRLPWWLKDDRDPEEIGLFEAGEIRRRGIKGRRALHYDLSLVPAIPHFAGHAVAANGLLGFTLPGMVGLSSTIVTAAVTTAIIYALNHFRWRAKIVELFDQAFET